MGGFLLDSPQHEWSYLHYFKFMHFSKITVRAVSRNLPIGMMPLDETRQMMGALSFACMPVLLCSIGLVVPE